MAEIKKELFAFNRGVVSKRGLARVDLDRLAMSAEVQKNFMPRVLGSMMLRPGTKFIDYCLSSLDPARQIPFVFGPDDTALIELNSGTLSRVRVDDVVVTRAATIGQITNGDFNTDLTGWTVVVSGTNTIIWDTGAAKFDADGLTFARLYQAVTVDVSEEFSPHCVEIVCAKGFVFKIGTTLGDDDLYPEQRLGGGTYNIEFVAQGSVFYVELKWDKEYAGSVTRCRSYPAGDMTLPLIASNEALANVRWEQSGDVLYLCSGPTSNGDKGLPQRKIERRGNDRSWGIVGYAPEDGPFRVQNTSALTLTPSAVDGNITLTASDPLFKVEHSQSATLWRIASNGQVVTDMWSGAPFELDPGVRVVGSETARDLRIFIEGTFVATVHLQFAFDKNGPWTDQGQTWTAPNVAGGEVYNDGQEGSIIYYRLAIKSGNWTSGTVTATLQYYGGSIEGIARTTAYTSPTVINAQVLTPFGGIDASSDWWEGAWSYLRGWPSAVSLTEGRLWWAGFDDIYGSVSDAYESYDDTTEGDSGPILRTIGTGAIRTVNWLLGLGRLLLGTSDNSANVAAAKMNGNNVLAANSTSYDEPMTPSNFNIVTMDSKGVFVDRSKQRLYELAWAAETQDYGSIDLSIFAPDFNVAGIKQIAVQMKPDIRVHCVREDGTVGMLIYDRLENVICWVDIELGGYVSDSVEQAWVEDVAILPGTVEDQVYYTVLRNTGPSGLGEERYLEKWSLESEAIGGNLNYLADSCATYDGAPISLMTGLEHLQGLEVVIWADGQDRGTGTVTLFGTPGELDLSAIDGAPFSTVVVGLAYTGQFKSAKLGAIQGFDLLGRKRVNRVGFIAENLHYQGLQYGPDFNTLYDMPRVEKGIEVPVGTIHEDYHEDDFAFGGEWNTDSRICLQAQSPRPATVLALIAEIESIERMDQPRRR